MTDATRSTALRSRIATSVLTGAGLVLVAGFLLVPSAQAGPETTVAAAAASGSPCPTASPTSTASPSATSTATTSPTASSSSSASPTSTASPTGTSSPSSGSSGLPSILPTIIGGGGSPTGSGSPSSTASPSATSSASASGTPTPSGTASPTGSPSPSPCVSASPSQTSATPTATIALTPLKIAVNPSDIVPTQTSTVYIKGEPNKDVDLLAYTRPNTTYGVVRSATTNANGTLTFTVTPGANTRLYAHYRNASASSDSPSVVITVHTSLSLSAYRDGVRRYHFQGTNLPRRPGQLITLYRYATGPNLDRYCVPPPESDVHAQASNGCVAIRTAIAYTNSTNVWRINRTFTGSGQFYFVVRTSQTLNNGRGHSNQRLTVIH